MDAEPGPPEGLPPAVRGFFQDRADELVRAALDRTPAEERPGFWRKYVQADPAWSAVRGSLGFARLTSAYAGPQE